MNKFLNNKNTPYTFDKVIRIIISLSIIVLMYLAIRRLSDVLLPFVIGFLIAYYLNPVVLFFQNKLKIKYRGISIVLTLLLFVLVFAGILWLIIPQIIDESQKMKVLIENYTQTINLGSIIPPAWQTEINNYINRFDIKELLSNDNFTNTLKNIFPKLWDFINSSISFLVSLLVVFFIFIYAIFILIDYEKFKSSIAELVPTKYKKITGEVGQDVKNAVNSYFRGQGLVALITGILLMIGFSIIGLPMALVMGAIMGLMCMVPYLHGFGLIPAAILGLLKAQETGQSILMVWLSILIVFLIVQAIQDYILVPKIMKEVTGLRPAMVLLSLSIWGSLMGIIGMIIALPLTVVILAYYKRFIIDDEPIEAVSDKKESITEEKDEK